jgi:D-xylose transport system substrate-binding protein
MIRFLRNVIVLLAVAVFFVSCKPTPKPIPTPKKAIRIGVSLPTQREEIVVRAAREFEKVAKEMNVRLFVRVADENPMQQMEQCKLIYWLFFLAMVQFLLLSLT